MVVALAIVVVVVLLGKQLFELFEIVIFDVAKAWWAVGLLAVNTGVAVFKTCNNLFTFEAFTSGRFGIPDYHTHSFRLTGISVHLHTLVFGTKAKTVLLSLMKDEVVGEVLDQFKVHFIQAVYVELPDTLMSVKLITCVLFIADLAHNFYFWALHFYMIVELSSCQMLILIKIANVTTKFRAMILGMSL